ncbi:MAG: CBS domain-containing protein [Vicinamibacterales bacterium]
MTVKDVMTRKVGACPREADLSAAVKVMAEHDCGFVPVIDSHAAVVGVITDRDVCNAVATLSRPPSLIAVSEVMSHPVRACFPDEALTTVLVTMGKHRVRRLPVLDKKTGRLQGVLSIDDVVLASRRRGSPTSEDIVDALKAICRPRPVEIVPS